MNDIKRARLEAEGWTIGNADAFLDLSAEESAYVELKLALASLLAERRKAASLTQVALARQVKTSQSRLAKMEHADESVSVDLLVRTLLAMGTSLNDIARVIAA